MWAPNMPQSQLEAQQNAHSLAATLWAEQSVAGWPNASSSLQNSQSGPLPPTQPGDSPTAVWPGIPPAELAHSQHSAASNAKLYVQGLPQNLQHPVAVAGLFSPFGDVLDVKLYAAEVRLSGGSAVVRMRNSAQAAAAVTALNGVVPEGGWQQLTVRAAETAEQRSSRITAINGRQQGGTGGGGPGSPLAHALPPTGPGSTGAAAALRRVHSARGGGSHGALHCFTGGLTADVLASAVPMPMQHRRSLDWPPGSGASLDSSRRSSMDVARCGSAAGGSLALLPPGGGRTSSDSGSGSGCDDLNNAGGGGDAGMPAAGLVPPAAAELQRMLLEAVLALLGQVESGQLSLPAMRMALESALTAAKHAGGASPADEAALSGPEAVATQQGRSPTYHPA